MTGALPAGLDRPGLVAAVQAALEDTVAHSEAVVLAVSGGPDSTALAYLVPEARPDLRVCVAHVRHGLRDDSADAAVAAGHAAALGVEYVERSVNARGGTAGPEAAARRTRYEALRAVAVDNGAAWIAVGHSADDQAETVLLNLARGAGLSGLAGMAPVRGEGPVRVVRPLLRVRRADLRAFCTGEGVETVADPTNTDPDQRRARVRAEALPALARLSGGAGDPVAALTRLADLARADAAALDAQAAAHARRLLVAWGPAWAVRSDALQRLAPALASRVVRLLLTRVRGRAAGLSAAAVQAALDLQPGQAVHVSGGAWVTAGADWLAAVPPGTAALAHRVLALPGVTPLPELGMAVHADLPDVDVHGQGRFVLTGQPLQGQPGRVAGPLGSPPGPLAPTVPARAAGGSAWALLASDCAAGLAVRAPRPGDKLRLAAGRRKLSDVLIDAGVPRALRGLTPVVVDARDQPVWVAGVALRWSRDVAGPRLWLAPLAAPGQVPEA